MPLLSFPLLLFPLENTLFSLLEMAIPVSCSTLVNPVLLEDDDQFFVVGVVFVDLG